eukprot:UN06758
MDGNRRYGMLHHQSKLKGHEAGAKTFNRLQQWALKRKIKEITVYAWSSDNFNRSQEEQSYFFTLIEKIANEVKSKVTNVNPSSENNNIYKK